MLDLRTPGELDERGHFTHDSVGYHHLPILRRRGTATRSTSKSTRPSSSPPATSRCSTRAATRIGRALRILADPTRCPLVFHCAAGKDRTGVVAAIVLDLLGVRDDDIADDYSLSRLGMDRFRAWIIETYPEAADAMSDQPQAFLAAPAEAMHLFLSGLRDRHGSVDDYVAVARRARRRARRGAGEPAHARLTSAAVMDAPPYVDGHQLLAGKTVLVTAAAGTGIGFATAKRCVEEGARVVISDAHERRLGEAAESLGRRRSRRRSCATSPTRHRCRRCSSAVRRLPAASTSS